MIRLALVVGRLDFWNLGKELSPYQLALWRAAEVVQPFGPVRDDMRMAVQTLGLIQSQTTKQLDQDQRSKIVSGLMGYLGNNDENEAVTMDESARQCKAAFGGIGL